MRRTAIHTVEATLECVSGLRVGGSQDELRIGGMDNPVIKDPVTGAAYVPGSSLKGKMRAELEKHHERFNRRDKTKPCDCAEDSCPVCRIFGPHTNTDHRLGPTRLLVRDAPLVYGGKIEVKSETAIDRQTGRAARGSLRPQERVAAGSTFQVRIGVQIYDLDVPFRFKDRAGQDHSGKDAILEVVREGLHWVEQTGLGAGTSRGSGQVKFVDLKLDGAEWK
jgi:CRISPR-associated protein Csm3